MPARTEHSVAFQVPAALNASPLCEKCLMRRWLSRGSQCGSSLLSFKLVVFRFPLSRTRQMSISEAVRA